MYRLGILDSVLCWDSKLIESMLMHGHFVVFEGRVLICIFLQGSILNVIEKTTFTNSLTIGEACSYCCFNSIIINLRVLSPWMYVYIHTCTKICTIYWNPPLSLSTSKSNISLDLYQYLSHHFYLFTVDTCQKMRFCYSFLTEAHVIDIFRSKVKILYMYLLVCKIYYE